MKVKCKKCSLIHEEDDRIQILSSKCDYDKCPGCESEEAEELTLKDKIIEIVGFGMEYERAELMASQIEILFTQEAISQLKRQSKLNSDIVDKCFSAMGIKS